MVASHSMSFFGDGGAQGTLRHGVSFQGALLAFLVGHHLETAVFVGHGRMMTCGGATETDIGPVREEVER